MDTLESLKGRIKTTKNLRNIVSSMKTLSAVSITQYEKAALVLDHYTDNVKYGLKVAIKDTVSPMNKEAKYEKAAAVIIGSDQGLVGRFNAVLAKYAKNYIYQNSEIKNPDKTRYIATGRSMGIKMLSAKMDYDHLYNMPGSVKGITGLAQTLTLKLNEMIEKHNIKKVILFNNHIKDGTSFTQRVIRLLPIDAKFLEEIREMEWPTKQMPTTHLPTDEMFSSLVQQLIFIRIYKALAENLAAEHLTRMISMQNAEKNIDEHLETMNLAYQQRRQQEITDELIDIVTGAEVLNQEIKKKKKKKKKQAQAAALGLFR